MEETPGNFDIHDRKKRLRKQKELVLRADICKEDKDLILEFVNHKARVDEISLLRQAKLLFLLRNLAKHLGKPFAEATQKDIEDLIYKISTMDVKRGERIKKISESTVYDYKEALKMLFRWLKKEESSEETSWIKLKQPKTKPVRPEDNLTWDDAVTLSRAAMNDRDFAIPQVLWDVGGRAEEVLTLLLKDVIPVAEGQALQVHFRKSKREESLRNPVIVRSAPALTQWISRHPYKDNPDAPLFCKISNCEPMGYSTLRKVLLTLKERSGLKKPVNSHNFRKSSASFYAHSPELSELEVKTRYGWTKDSKMLRIYARVDEKKVNDKILQMNGLKEKTDSNGYSDKMKPVQCRFCSTIVPAGQEFCNVCKRPANLTPEENLLQVRIEQSVNEVIREIIFKENPDLIESIRNRISGKRIC